jgi:hypothetical protein
VRPHRAGTGDAQSKHPLRTYAEETLADVHHEILRAEEIGSADAPLWVSRITETRSRLEAARTRQLIIDERWRDELMRMINSRSGDRVISRIVWIQRRSKLLASTTADALESLC